MSSPLRMLLPAAVLFTAAVAASPRPAAGCAVFPRPGQKIETADETALIVWDAASKTEHFIRTASFRAGAAAGFGFVVPTPGVPELAEADAAVFGVLGELTKPRVEYVTEYIDVDPPPMDFGCAFGNSVSATFAAAGLPKSAPVDVISRQKVGGYDAAVLKADDANALDEWLVKNGYSSGPEQKAWLKWYTDHRWVLTAFKVSAVDGNGPPKLAPVRLSFPADRPFYPYREPAAPKSAKILPRSLRVFLLAETKYDGTLGTGSDPWPGETKWAKKLDRPTSDGALTAGKLPAGLHGRDWHLTEFDDRSSPRPGTDEVYFSPAKDPADVERPPIIVKNYVNRVRPRSYAGVVLGVFAGLPLLGLICGLVGKRIWRDRRA